MSDKMQKIINYYTGKESKWGYKLVLGGTKHFGYYESGQKIPMRQAMKRMASKLGERLDLASGSLVLDAGCGIGTTAIQLNQEFGYKLEGIDILDFNIEKANTLKNRLNISGVNFSIGDYHNLSFNDETFDGVYTVETLVHAIDFKKALSEMYRVLKPNAKLVLFEYSMPKANEMSDKQTKAYEAINEGSAMHSFKYFTHGSFPELLSAAGFANIKVEDITRNILPMVRRFYQMAYIPYQFVRLFGKEIKFVNTTAGYELYKHKESFRYNIITANKRP